MNAPTSTLKPCTLARTDAARVSLVAAVARFSLRARGNLAPLNAALGLELPGRIGSRAATASVQVLCLGPDEWILHAPEAAAAGIIAACAAIAPTLPHSLVEVSGRELSFGIDGPKAAELLTLGCPRDIDSIAAGQGRRTLFDGVQVILWRDGADAFRLDVWHSFAPHVLHLLETGCKELAAEAL